ncbi:hypothetical protein U9M48_028967 [Paspalum notatum var. saurae]|uniref:KIB1-4 beta-propeller domain-containing protein n=1 Tax=Paspalum notatum var. saurae TaxID=547442 RepID=A0AAQ3X119_PASNO
MSKLLSSSTQTNPNSYRWAIWGAKRARSARAWRDWANLGDGPAGVIAELLLASDVADFVSFRSVCRRWRLCSIDPHAHGILDTRFHPRQRQWITLRGTWWATRGSPYCLGFLNESTGCSRYLQLQELHGHDVFGPTTEGLLVLVDRNTYAVRLLNPFTRQAAKLPSITTLMSERDVMRLKDTGSRPGDTDWTVVHRGTFFRPAVSCAGRFYCATNRAVMVVETSADQPPRLAVAANLIRPFYRIMLDSVHLVDNGGELMLVDRKCPGHSEREYEVYRLDLDAREMVPVRGFGGRAVFIGRQLTRSVSPLVFPSIDADSIYLGFESHMTGELDNSPIHLMDGTSSPRPFPFKFSIEGSPLHGPLGIDDYLSWSVIGYRINP